MRGLREAGIHLHGQFRSQEQDRHWGPRLASLLESPPLSRNLLHFPTCTSELPVLTRTSCIPIPLPGHCSHLLAQPPAPSLEPGACCSLHFQDRDLTDSSAFKRGSKPLFSGQSVMCLHLGQVFCLSQSESEGGGGGSCHIEHGSS